MATVTKLDAHKWRVRYDEYDAAGKRHQRMRDFTRAGDANAFKLQVETGKIPKLEAAQPFAAYARAWLESIAPTIAQNTYRSRITTIKHISDYFGATRRIDQIKPLDIERYYADMLKTNKPSTLQLHKQVLNSVFKHAIKDGIITDNPVQRAKIPTNKRAASDRDLPQLADVLECMADHEGTASYTALALALYGGMRCSEILGLKWSDIDFTTNRINVMRLRLYVAGDYTPRPETNMRPVPDLPKWYERDGTKNGRTRSFIMPQTLADILHTEQQRQRINRMKLGVDYMVTDYVCVKDNGKPVTANIVRYALKDVCNVHALRHLNVSYLFDAGIPLTEISRRVGHSSTAVTMAVYAHALTAQDDAAATALDNAMNITSITHQDLKAR